MTANYSTREYREKLYDDLHVRLRDTAILMCAIFYCLYRSKYEFNSCYYWSHVNFTSHDTDCWTGIRFSYFLIRVLIKAILQRFLLTQVLVSFACLDSVFLDFSLVLCKQRVDRTNLSNHLGCSHCYCWWDSRFHWFKEKRSKQYRTRSSHRNSSDATYLHCRLRFS